MKPTVDSLITIAGSTSRKVKAHRWKEGKEGGKVGAWPISFQFPGEKVENLMGWGKERTDGGTRAGIDFSNFSVRFKLEA